MSSSASTPTKTSTSRLCSTASAAVSARMFIPATAPGSPICLSFCRDHVGPEGRLVAFGVEGTGSYGVGLARFLRRHGQTVQEVHRPPRKGERRMSGKSDTIDAEHAARQVLAGRRDRHPEDRRRAGRGVTADQDRPRHRGEGPDQRDDHVEGDPGHRRRRAPRRARAADRPQAGPGLRRAGLRHLAGRPRRGDAARPADRWRVAGSTCTRRSRPTAAHLKVQTKAAAPQLVEAVGVGLDIAAEMLVTAGDNSDRVRSESAFAKMCGACPIPAGSGKTNGRHRLNRGGNRQANAALYRAVIVRMRWHQPTIDYVTRRTAEGLSKREIIRCLKRFLAREIYRLLPPPWLRRQDPRHATTDGGVTT